MRVKAERPRIARPETSRASTKLCRRFQGFGRRVVRSDPRLALHCSRCAANSSAPAWAIECVPFRDETLTPYQPKPAGTACPTSLLDKVANAD